MNEFAEIIEPGFSVADAERPELKSVDSGLQVTFKDWREQLVSIIFVDALSYRWDQIDWNFLENERFDSSHVIHNSTWLKTHFDQHAISEKEDFRHYRLNFNAAGTLQVIAKSIRNTAEQDAAANP